MIKYLENILNLSNDRIITFDNDKNITWCNKQFLKLADGGANGILGSKANILDNIFFTENNEPFSSLISLNTKTPVGINWKNNFGKTNYGFLNITPIIDNNETIGIYTVINDSTHSGKTAHKLKESEAKYETLVNCSPEGILIIQDKIIQFANKACMNLLDYNVNELPGMKISGIVCEEYLDYFYGICNDCIDGKKTPDLFQIEIKSKNGNVIPVEISSSLINHMDRDAILLFIRNISNRLQIAEVIMQREEMLKTVFNASKDAMVTINEKGAISLFNPAAELMFGRKQNEVVGEKLDILIPENFKAEHKNNVDSFFKNGHPNGAINKIVELPAARSNGEEFPIALSLADGAYNDKKFVLAVIRDITEEKKNKEEIKKMNEELERKVSERTVQLKSTLDELKHENEERKRAQDELEKINEELSESRQTIEEEANRLVMLNDKLIKSEDKLKNLIASKDKFFSIIAHDLKGPFSGFLGLSELIALHFDNLDKEALTQMAESLYKSAKQLFALLENLLEWSKIQRGLVEFTPGKVRLHKLVAKNIQLMEANAEKKNILLINNIDVYQTVFADFNMISTVFRNLLSNAVKFTDKNGEIIISSQKAENNAIEITVSDNGVGMSSEAIDKVFRIDSRYTRTGTSDEKGSGLGLLLCKELIEKNKGSIRIESVKGKGSDFIVSLPEFVNG